jgi:hypothetical protein
VGFYIKNHISYTVIDSLSPFENKIIEAISLQIKYPNNQNFIISSIYRSNGPIHNVTPRQQLDGFLSKFDALLAGLNEKNLSSYVFIDSNIDLLRLGTDNSAAAFFNNIVENGFLQLNMKATRFQNNSKTLIDQILSNSKEGSFFSGSVVSDISDHFFTFLSPFNNP